MSRSVIPKMDDVSPRQEGSSTTILRRRFSIEKDPSESTRLERKVGTKLDGSYVIKRAFTSGALVLLEMDGNDLPSLINSDAVKKYYV